MAQKAHSHPLTMLRWFLSITLALVIFYLCYSVGNLQTAVNQLKQNNNQTITSASYTCDNRKTIQAQYFNNTVELNLSDGSSKLLMQAISGSGVRFTNSDETFTFWNKGNTAFIEEGPNNTVTYNNCVESNSN